MREDYGLYRARNLNLTSNMDLSFFCGVCDDEADRCGLDDRSESVSKIDSRDLCVPFGDEPGFEARLRSLGILDFEVEFRSDDLVVSRMSDDSICFIFIKR